LDVTFVALPVDAAGAAHAVPALASTIVTATPAARIIVFIVGSPCRSLPSG
jgi:hypothetical protein